MSGKPTLEQFQQQLADRGFTKEATKVSKELEEQATAERIRKFYCAHQFQYVRGTFLGFQTNMKVCKRCGFIR